jgi:hypothetical protein
MSARFVEQDQIYLTEPSIGRPLTLPAFSSEIMNFELCSVSRRVAWTGAPLLGLCLLATSHRAS